MESPDSAERKWACVAVSNLIQNDPSTRRLLQGKNIVGALITRLTDAEEEVVLEAMGSLRNLCIDGGYDICAEMYNKNILTPLKIFIPKISETLSDPSKVSKNSPIHLFVDNVITAFWCLSETSNKALNAINAINLVPFLMSFLMSRDNLPLLPVTAAAQCLYVLTDDNEPAIREVRSNTSYIAALRSIISSNDSETVNDDISAHRLLTLRVLSSGILRNVSPLPPSPVSGINVDKDIVLPLLTPVISSLSVVDISDNTQMLLTQLAEEQPTKKPASKHAPKSDHKSQAERALELLEARLRTVQLSLEILTGSCAVLPDHESSTGVEENENEDEDEETDMVDTEDTGMDVEPEGESGQETTAVLPSLVPPLLALIRPTSLSFPPLAAPSPYPPITSAISAVHISALECLSNIFFGIASHGSEAVSKEVDSGRKIWDDVWSALASVGTESGLGQERRRQMWEIAVGVLWGIGNVWKSVLVPNEEQVQLLIQFYEASTETQVRVKCVGTLECLAQYPSVDSNQVISKYLLSLLPESQTVTDVEPVLQAASALIDIYSDESLPYDINFRQGQYLDRLIRSVAPLKAAVKTIDKRKAEGRALRRRGDEVVENLVAFIEYRKDLGL